jgi:hypothetical protein
MNIQTSKLRTHQVPLAEWLTDLLTKHDAAVDLSDTGVGKTFTACAVANALKLPTLVVCPKIVISAWKSAAAHFNDSFSITNYEKLRTGRTPYGAWDNNPPANAEERARYYQCQCCQIKFDTEGPWEPCYCHPAGIHCFTEKVRDWKYGKFNWNPAVRLVIFDEIHRCSGLDSLNADMLIAAKQKVKVLGLSATLANSPLQMRATGFILNLHTLDGGLNNFWSWATKQGCRKLPMAGWKWAIGQAQQLQRMGEIRATIIPSRGVRIASKDIPGFPAVHITSELYDLDESPEIIDRLYGDMADALKTLEDRSRLDACPEHPMTLILRARQKIELLKVPIFCELAKDFRAKGFSVVHFVNFRQTLEELAKRRGIKAIIDGSPEGVKKRDYWREEFQANRERELAANNDAGGIGISLQDLHGDFPRIGLVSPGFSATTMKQVFGRLPRDGGKSIAYYRVILAARTVEASVHRALKVKLNNLDALNDFDLMPENLQLTNASLLHTFK